MLQNALLGGPDGPVGSGLPPCQVRVRLTNAGIDKSAQRKKKVQKVQVRASDVSGEQIIRYLIDCLWDSHPPPQRPHKKKKKNQDCLLW